MLTPTIYIICKSSNPALFRTKLLKDWSITGKDVVLQIDALDESMKQLLQCMPSRFCNIVLEYYTMHPPEGADRRYLFSLEKLGIDVSIKIESLIGQSVYAAMRRHKYRIRSADYVLIVYDQMDRTIQSLISYAAKKDVEASIICCCNS